MSKPVFLEIDSQDVARVTLNRPEKRNAMSGEMIAELSEIAKAIDDDPLVRAVVLSGAGGNFCAGGDLSWMRDQIGADAPTRAAEAKKLANMLGAWNALAKPVIGRVEGLAFGGGVGLACICDVAFCTPATKFGLTETKLGLIPATIGPYVLARMGEGPARRVFMNSRIFSGEEAQELGIAKVVDDLDRAIKEEVDAYLNCAPGAVAEAKKLALKLGQAPDQSMVDASIEALVRRWEDEESGEGIDAFFGKRKAKWVH